MGDCSLSGGVSRRIAATGPALIKRRLFLFEAHALHGLCLVCGTFIAFMRPEKRLKQHAEGQPFEHTDD